MTKRTYGEAAPVLRVLQRYGLTTDTTAKRGARRAGANAGYITGTLEGACALEHTRLSHETGPDVTRHISRWIVRKRDASAKLFCAGLRTSLGCVLPGLSSTEQTARQYKTIPRVLAGSDVRVSAALRVPGAHTALGKMAACVLPLIERLQQSIQGRATHKRASDPRRTLALLAALRG
jgi:hypothetical protein